ncbi:hypothetical protein ACSQ67_015511 [Phaseolus vulgaris]
MYSEASENVKGEEGTRSGGGGGRASLKGAHKINACGFGAYWIRSPKWYYFNLLLSFLPLCQQSLFFTVLLLLQWHAYFSILISSDGTTKGSQRMVMESGKEHVACDYCAFIG